jgi:hypothetical protein
MSTLRVRDVMVRTYMGDMMPTVLEDGTAWWCLSTGEWHWKTVLRLYLQM